MIDSGVDCTARSKTAVKAAETRDSKNQKPSNLVLRP